MPTAVDTWLAALEARHLENLRFAEVTRALRALSATYVERRTQLARGASLQGVGKRAAFALFYGPLHFCLVREIVRALGAASGDARPLVDVGCGTGVAGAAWALEFARHPRLVGVDRHPWALAEAAWTYRTLGLHAQTVCNDVARHRLPGPGAAVIAAYVLNELDSHSREQMRARLLGASERGARVLIVEPIAGPALPEWATWVADFEQAGGRADEWRVSIDLPDIVRKLDRAAGLDHRIVSARSLFLAGTPGRSRPS